MREVVENYYRESVKSYYSWRVFIQRGILHFPLLYFCEVIKHLQLKKLFSLEQKIILLQHGSLSLPCVSNKNSEFSVLISSLKLILLKKTTWIFWFSFSSNTLLVFILSDIRTLVFTLQNTYIVIDRVFWSRAKS